MSITPEQCRMARAALDIGVRDLAKISDVSPNTIARLERGDKLHKRTLDYIRGALEAEGVTFIPSRAVSAQGGPGIRLGADGAKSPFGKVFEAMWNLPDFRAEPARVYSALLDIFGQYLDIVQGEDREPDVWERIDLNDALNSLNRSDVFSAASYLRHAITPPDNQSLDYRNSTDATASTATLDLACLRRCVLGLQTRGYVQ
jgi:transcriptional regulator with XRE-family HTH domain